MDENKALSCKAMKIGGQAVIEGVMMKGKEKYTVTVRRSDGTLVAKTDGAASLCDRYKVLSWPILRGVIRFAESLVIGMKTLNFSASFFDDEEKKDEKERKDTAWNRFKDKYGDSLLTLVSGFLGVLLAVFLFIWLPGFLVGFLRPFIPSGFLCALLEGVVRVCVFVLYIVAISGIKDIRRLFEYHGAEHKTINCMEDGQTLTPRNVLPYTRLNRRCGTSFIFLVMVISILFFSLVYTDNMLLKVLYKLLLIPVVAGVSYEILMLSNKYPNPVLRAFVWPGLQLQRLTTREPDESEIEAAIASTLKVLEAEGRLPGHLREDWERVRPTVEWQGEDELPFGDGSSEDTAEELDL